MLAASLLYPQARVCMIGSREGNLKRFLERYHNKFEIIKEKNVSMEEVSKIISVDNRDVTRMGKVGDYLAANREEMKRITIICYDHHPSSQNDIESDYSHVELTGACTTIMLTFLKNAGIQISPFYASIFALGIYEDTGNFLNASITANDFAAASYLFSVGASLDLIREFLPKEFSPRQLELTNKMLSLCETISIKGMEVSFIELRTEGYRDDIAYLLQTVKASRNLKLIFCICYREEKVQVIARNDYEFIFLDKLLQELGGGGHRSAGFASLPKEEADNLKNRIIDLLEQQVVDYGTASDIMTVPVDIAPRSLKISEAREFLISKHYSTLIIGDENRIAGILTKKDISRAIHHQMSDMPVESCMSLNVITVKENESIYKVYKTMVDFNIGRIPVTDNEGRVTGIITRSDLLHYHFHFQFKKKEAKADFESIKQLMLKNLEKEIIELLKQAGHVAETLGMKAYIVGGFVRDLIMQRYNYDLDLVIEGDGLLFAEKFTEKFGKKMKPFPQFGTAYVVLKNNRKIDIATARTEFYAGSGSLPDVEYSNIRNDIYRRDFTINSLAVSLNPKQFGILHDYFGGRRDIRLGLIKVLNNMSFIEDPIRVLRAIRFEQRFGFTIEEKTLHLLTGSLRQKSLKTVSVERIRSELIISCKKGAADSFFYRLEELGILKDININLVFTTKKREICRRINDLSIWFANSFPAEDLETWICYHLALLEDLSLRIRIKITKQLKYSNYFVDCVYKVVRFTETTLKELEILENKGEIAFLLKNLNKESIIYLIAYADNLRLKEKLLYYLTTSRFVRTELDGDDLIELGVPEGKEIGVILSELWKAKINHELPDKEAELSYVKKLLKERSKA
jgi:tRNA nucleotidyltransferase (CCA-adding enzyme)